MRWGILLSAVVAVALCGAAEATSQPQAESAVGEAATNRGSSRAPLFVKVVPAPSAEADAREEREDRQRAIAANNWMVALTVVLAVFAFAQVIVTGITIKGLRHAKIAAEAADKAAEAAKKTVDTMAAAERAYVFFLDTRKIDTKTAHPAFRVIWRNFGKTPAMVTGVRLGIVAGDAPPNPAEMPRYEMPFGAIIGAGEEWPRGQVSMKNAVDDASKDSLPIYLAGEVTYLDIHEQPHRTWFCRLFTGAQFILDPDIDRDLNGYS